jgi:hypothetical protein
VIAAFDRLARSAYADVKPRTVLADRVNLRQEQWNAAVEQLLVDALRDADPESSSERQLALSPV